MPDPKYPPGHDPMAEHIDRVSDNFEDPFDRHRASRGRLGWKDWGHSITNIFVEFCRAYPYSAGHWWLYQSIVTVIAFAFMLAALVKLA